jgi:polyhydroxyalkanoate synthesis regulator phasin
MLLSVNLVRRQQELQAQLMASDTQGIIDDLAVKRQDLKDAKAAVDEATRQLKSKTDQIDKQTKQIQDLKNAKEELKVCILGSLHADGLCDELCVLCWLEHSVN